MLEFAKSKGDYLVVGIDSDSRVNELKGPERPFNNEMRRKEFLESIKFVDEVFIFSSDADLVDFLVENKIEMIVIGEEYKGRNIVGSSVCPVEFFQRIPGLSTTIILDNIKHKE